MNKNLLKLLVRVTVSAVLIGFLISRVDWPEVRAVAERIQFLWFLPIFLGMFITSTLSSWKWSLFLKADDIHIPLPRLTASYMISTFFSCFLPSSIGGDVYRVYVVGKHAGTSKAMAAVAMGRITGFFTLALIGLLAALASRETISDPRVVWSISGVLAFLVVSFLLVCSRRVLALGTRIAGMLRLGKVAKVAGGVQESILRYRSRPAVIGGALLVSVLQQLTVVVSISLLARALGVDASLLYFLCFIPVIEAISAIPISIFGVGVRDSLYVLYFGTVGISQAECLGMSLLYVTVTLLYSSLGGLLYLARQGEISAATAEGSISASYGTPATQSEESPTNC